MTASSNPSTFKPFSLPSSWIWSSEAIHTRRNGSLHDSAFEVRFFRKSFTLNEIPRRFVVAISADGRYDFFFNGRRVGRGPSKGDVRHQFFTTYDLTEWMHLGENVLAVRVVDYSPVKCYPPQLGAPASVMSFHGGLAFDGWLEGDTPQHIVGDESWRVWIDQSLEFVPDEEACKVVFGGFVGYFEKWHVENAELGWQEIGYNDQNWANATLLDTATRIEDHQDTNSQYGLLASLIKSCREGEPQHFADVFLPGGGEAPQSLQDWAQGKGELVCRAGESFTCILDAAKLQTGFPRLQVQGGAGASIRITYAEALRLPSHIDTPFSLRAEGDLSSVALGDFSENIIWSFDRRGTLVGFRDVILPDGRYFEFEPTHWRTFRYIKMEVTVAEKEIRVSPLTYRFYAYPLDFKTEIQTTRQADQKLWDISARTLQLCCHETFEDCPYYEQLQYSGDSLISSRLMLYLTGDGSLTRQALHHFDWSRTTEGITGCRYPSTMHTVIPSWSLHWISMVHDYVLFTGDRSLGKTFLPSIDLVLTWFRRHSDVDSLPSKLPNWNCVDWTPGWKRGQPPGSDTGVTCAIACQFVQALREVAALREWCAMDHAEELRNEAQKCGAAIERRFWHEEGGCYRDAETEEAASVLANAWAVCAGIVPKEKEARVAERLSQWSPGNVSYFGMFWVFRALRLLGQGQWWRNLNPWEKLLDTGLTTWPEDTAFWRSLCHAWSAHPLSEYLEGALGLRVEAPGWSEVTLSPNLGPLPSLKFCLCTPHGEMSGNVEKTEAGLRFEIAKPMGIRLRVTCGKASVVMEAPKEQLCVHLSADQEAVALS